MCCMSNFVVVVRFVDIHVADSRELQKVASKKDVDTSKVGIRVRFDFTELSLQISEELRVHHTDLIDNQVVPIEPQIHNFLADTIHLPIFPEPNRAVKSTTADFDCCCTGSRCD